MKILKNRRPRIAEYLLISFAVLSLLASAMSFWNSEYGWSHNQNYTDPFAAYNADIGIRLINIIASVIDALSIGAVLAWALRAQHLKAPVKILMVLAICGALLTWFELWYGATFYYGEVRDKQGLPFGVNHGGALGSFFFLTYIIWRIDWFPASRKKRVGISALMTMLLIVFQIIVLKILEEPWALWRS